jgi:hypothetical protein
VLFGQEIRPTQDGSSLPGIAEIPFQFVLRVLRASRLGAGSGIHKLIWNAPLLAERTWLAQAVISAGCIKGAPQASNPPAFAIAVESEGALAPDIGASSTGAR